MLRDPTWRVRVAWQCLGAALSAPLYLYWGLNTGYGFRPPNPVLDFVVPLAMLVSFATIVWGWFHRPIPPTWWGRLLRGLALVVVNHVATSAWLTLPALLWSPGIAPWAFLTYVVPFYPFGAVRALFGCGPALAILLPLSIFVRAEAPYAD